jgi:hypothetical protein
MANIGAGDGEVAKSRRVYIQPMRLVMRALEPDIVQRASDSFPFRENRRDLYSLDLYMDSSSE